MTAPDCPILCPPRKRSEPIDGGVMWRAPAKINLTLRVGASRVDGFHGLDSLVAKITLYDDLEFRPRADGQVVLQCEGFACGKIEDNLVYRAATLMQERGTAARGCASGAGPGLPSGCEIRLVKNIPPGSGLGGGSSNAATTLLALNELWSLKLPQGELAQLAARLGSDVPLFLDGPSVHMRGRGEIVEPIAVGPFWAVLYLSGLHCATGAVYKAFDEQCVAGVSPAGTAGGSCATRGAPGALVGQASTWPQLCVNDLQGPALAICPELAEVMRRLADATGEKVLMTGSGSGLFLLADDQQQATALTAKLPQAMQQRCRVVALNGW